MVKINYAELRFDHLVRFTHDRTIFAAARENGSGHIRLFLIFEEGNVYSRNGRADSWEHLTGQDAETVRAKITDAQQNHTPTYTINGHNGSL